MLYLIKPFVCTFLWQQCGKGGKGGISSGILERFCEVCTAESSGSVGGAEFNTFVKNTVSSEPSTSEAGKGKGKGQNIDETDQKIDQEVATVIRDGEAKFSSKGTCPSDHTGIVPTPDCRSMNVCSDGVFKFALDCEAGDVFDFASTGCVNWYKGFVCGGGAEGDLHAPSSQSFSTFVKSTVSFEPSTKPSFELSTKAGKGKGKGQNQTASPTVTDSASPSVIKSSEPSTSEGMGQNTDIIVKKVVKVDEEGSPTASPVPSNPPTPTPTPTPFEPPTKSGKGKGKGQNTDETANTAIRDVEAKFSSKGTCPPGHTGFALTPDCRSTNVCRVGVFKFALDCEVGDVFDLALGRCVKWYRGFVCGVDAEGDLPSLAASSTLSSKPTVAASDSPLPVPRSRPIPEHSSSPRSAPSEGKKHGEPCKKSTWVEDIEANRVISALLDLIDFMRNDKN